MKYKHMTSSNRLKIEKGLNDNLSFKEIANKDCTTIAKEVKNHIIYKNTGAQSRPFFDCINRKNCCYKFRGEKCKPKTCQTSTLIKEKN